MSAIFPVNKTITLPEELVCSGIIPIELNNQPCPHSHDGKMPEVEPLDPSAPDYSIDKGKPGDLCPTCALSQLSSLGNWNGKGRHQYPSQYNDLRLFKCRQGFWVVIPGLYDAKPQQLSQTGAMKG